MSACMLLNQPERGDDAHGYMAWIWPGMPAFLGRNTWISMTRSLRTDGSYSFGMVVYGPWTNLGPYTLKTKLDITESLGLRINPIAVDDSTHDAPRVRLQILLTAIPEQQLAKTA